MSERRVSTFARVGLIAALSAAVALAAAVPGCLERRDDPPLREETRCAECHGDPSRSGDYLARAAPPRSLRGGSEPAYPGVGAHQIHLEGSSRHTAIACNACHIVPERTDDVGHADDAPPAEVVFDEAAALGADGQYDPGPRTCDSTYCHGDARPVWSRPRDGDEACGTCHGLPPAAPHPQSDRCSACHGAVVDEARAIIDPALHVNGVVDVEPASCTTCHGSGDTAAPPVDTFGGDARSDIGVGAHRPHLEATTGRPLECAECHVVPTEDDETSHVGGGSATVEFGALASTNGKEPSWDRDTATCSDTYCHAGLASSSAPSPVWTTEGPLGCDSCHGAPPPPPHPVMDDCSVCHGAVVGDDDRTMIDPSLHVNGVVDVSVPSDCTACHGASDPAPPPALGGITDTALSSVGAHRSHVDGSARARAVPCGECHVVPTETLAPGHIDTPRPAEVVFSGTATAYAASPEYDGTTCSGTCHGPVFPDGHDTVGTNTAPTWTVVDGTEAACGACHGLPPGPRHPLPDLNPTCSACHENIESDNVTFRRPELHVDGIVTFEVAN